MTTLYEINTRNKKEERMKPFWIIFVEHTKGGKHYRHETSESAMNESVRLARLPENIGKYVYMFECVGRCRVEEKPVKWETP